MLQQVNHQVNHLIHVDVLAGLEKQYSPIKTIEAIQVVYVLVLLQLRIVTMPFIDPHRLPTNSSKQSFLKILTLNGEGRLECGGTMTGPWS